MKRTMILATMGAVATIAADAPADAQRSHGNGWRTVGYTQVNGRDADTIRLPGTARYHQMRVCVFNGPIEVRDLDVRYRNGGRQDVNVRQMMRAGTCTRNVDLSGNRRDVTAVRIKYAPLLRGWARPIVRVQVR
jgi:hypothetical protein